MDLVWRFLPFYANCAKFYPRQIFSEQCIEVCEASIELETAPLETVSLTKDLSQSVLLAGVKDFGSKDFLYGESVVLKDKALLLAT